MSGGYRVNRRADRWRSNWSLGRPDQIDTVRLRTSTVIICALLFRTIGGTSSCWCRAIFAIIVAAGTDSSVTDCCIRPCPGTAVGEACFCSSDDQWWFTTQVRPEHIFDITTEVRWLSHGRSDYEISRLRMCVIMNKVSGVARVYPSISMYGASLSTVKGVKKVECVKGAGWCSEYWC